MDGNVLNAGISGCQLASPSDVLSVVVADWHPISEDLIASGTLNQAHFRPSFVYFLSDGRLTKIGASIRPWERAKQCGVKDFRPLFAIYIPEPRVGYDVESALHYKFKSKRELKTIGKRIAREWFCLSQCDLDMIKRIKVFRRNGAVVPVGIALPKISPANPEP